jgi:hypothetical protein
VKVFVNTSPLWNRKFCRSSLLEPPRLLRRLVGVSQAVTA